MPGWLKEWGQFVILLAALGGFYAFIRSDLSAMENRLGERIDRNADLISENTKAIGDVREAIAHLEGYVRGRMGDDLASRTSGEAP